MTPGLRQRPRVVTYAGFGVAFALLALAALISWQSQRRYQESVGWTEHSYDVLDRSSQLLITIQRAEGSARGYAITRQTLLRNDAITNLARVARELRELDSLIADNPEQLANLDSIRPLIRSRLVAVDSLIAARDRDTVSDPALAAIVARGSAINYPLRAAITHLTETERRLLDTHSTNASVRGQLTLVAVTGALILALLVIWGATAVTMRELAERTKAEEALKVEAERQSVIIEIQQAIATAHVADQQVLDLLVGQVMHLSDADGALLGIVDGEQYLVRSADGNVRHWRERRMPLKGSIVGWVVDHRELTIVTDAFSDPRVDQVLARATGNRSHVVVPVTDGIRAIGVLVVSSLRPNAFREPELASLRILSGILSAGIANSAAYEANERLLAELRESRDTAEKANRAKSSFLATMSHELRTPLNSVIGFANLLLRNRAGKFAEQDLQFLGRIRDNGVHLLGLINDVLDVSKIEAGRMEVHPVPTDLGPLVRETIAGLEGQAASRAVALRAITPEESLTVDVDPGRLKQVLINLIGNALKFTQAGSVTVQVVAAVGGRPLRIDVIDTGVGIPPDRLEAIFEAFTQAEATTERRFGGTGLGLTISRSILHLMGADLAVKSTPGEGSTFSITFPASIARAAADVAFRELTPAPAVPAGPAPLVLIVDDQADARTLLRSYLTEDGYRTAEAVDGEEGLRHAQALRPALITLDLRMPGMSGVEFLRRLRADPDLTNIPVLVVSIEAAEHRGSLLGAVDLLAKPVERDGLLGVVQRILPIGRRKVLVVDDDVHTRQLFAAVLGAEGYVVRTARDGLEAFSALDQELPDLVLLDLMMPVMDGGSFLATLRRNPRYTSLPVVVVTALDADSEAVRRLDGLAHAVVQKGDALEVTLRQLLQNVLGS